ncbi:hypothetical protein [Brevundimonas sp. Root1279]|uniref:hypothetical protein n=1 Tax=Brevundimonas sp. Root1279 TaxID=1736443 RepID=UPI0006F57A6F|nr:hypothetical protein [Brevundimonas sp. Root1279]KQW79703.1 hypothetical protein ASC65_14235 [Brevundimonas sp. Root1279]
MSAGDEFIMPVLKPDAVAEMHLHALRQISDSLSATNNSLATLANDVKDVRERVIRMEGEDVKGDLREVKADLRAACKRLDDLETIRDRQAGALSVGGWLSKYFPWLFGLAATAAAAVGWKT